MSLLFPSCPHKLVNAYIIGVCGTDGVAGLIAPEQSVCRARRTPSSTISEIIQWVGMTSNCCHIKTCGPFVDREGKGRDLTGSGGTHPR